MRGAQALRDKAEATRLLILAELQERPQATLSHVAVRLGITVQAVSAYAKEMAAAGRLQADAGAYQVTHKGLQSLHEGVRGLRDAVDGLRERLAVIQVTSAVAAATIRAGDEVGLYMQDGDLAARPSRTAPSRGIARTNARTGGEVLVGELKGMVELTPGRLTVITVPSPEEGGVARVDLAALKARLRPRGKADHTGAHGTGARILARTLSGPAHRPLDFEFAADHAAFNAAERGLAVHLYCSRDLLPDLMRTLERLNADTLRRVPIDLVEAPEASR